jgi:hypothetical protein
MLRRLIAVALCVCLAAALRSFSSSFELVKCIDTCEKAVSASLRSNRMDFVPPYHACLKAKDPYNCLIDSEHEELQLIGKCFDEECKPYVPEEPIPVER